MPPACEFPGCEFWMKVNLLDVNYGCKSNLSNLLVHLRWETKYKFHRLHEIPILPS